MLTTEGEYLDNISENVKTHPSALSNNRHQTNETLIPNNNLITNHMQISNNYVPQLPQLD